MRPVEGLAWSGVSADGSDDFDVVRMSTQWIISDIQTWFVRQGRPNGSLMTRYQRERPEQRGQLIFFPRPDPFPSLLHTSCASMSCDPPDILCSHAHVNVPTSRLPNPNPHTHSRARYWGPSPITHESLILDRLG